MLSAQIWEGRGGRRNEGGGIVTECDGEERDESVQA